MAYPQTFLYVVLVCTLLVALSSACTVSNCHCKGPVGPGMDCSTCTGRNCVCNCAASDTALDVFITNVTTALNPDSLAVSCYMNGCKCKSGSDCSTCTGKNCQCSCSAISPEIDLTTATGGCLTNSQCKDATCYSTSGSTTFCCPPNTQSCSVSVVNGVGQCSCY